METVRSYFLRHRTASQRISGDMGEIIQVVRFGDLPSSFVKGKIESDVLIEKSTKGSPLVETTESKIELVFRPDVNEFFNLDWSNMSEIRPIDIRLEDILARAIMLQE